MNISFDGICARPVTFACGEIKAGQVVKVDAEGKAAACSDGELFDGVAVDVKDGYAAVVMDGFVTVAYSGKAPTVGRAKAAADGQGGVKFPDSDGGEEKLVVGVDTVKSTVTLKI